MLNVSKIIGYLVLIYNKIYDKPYSDYYVKKALSVIKIKPHPTLGENFTLQGNYHFKKLKEKFRITPKDVVVDYGCGSLRIGKFFINYLNKNNYYGLDVTNIFYNLGLKRLDNRLIKNKKPNLYEINSKILKEISNKKIKIVYSIAVLIHIPPHELKSFLRNIFYIKQPDTKIYIDFLESNENLQVNKTSWIYERKFLIKEIMQVDSTCNIKFRKRISKKHSIKYKKATHWTSITIS